MEYSGSCEVFHSCCPSFPSLSHDKLIAIFWMLHFCHSCLCMCYFLLWIRFVHEHLLVLLNTTHVISSKTFSFQLPSLLCLFVVHPSELTTLGIVCWYVHFSYLPLIVMSRARATSHHIWICNIGIISWLLVGAQYMFVKFNWVKWNRGDGRPTSCGASV